MKNPFDAILPITRPLTAVLTDNVDAAWSQVQPWGDALGADSRLVACRWESVPRIDELIDGVVRTFAQVALADWPHWYGRVLIGTNGGNEFERNVALRSELASVSRQQVHVVTAWLKRAAESCLRNEIPFDPHGSRELQAGQLSLAVCSQQLVIVLCAGPGKAEGGATLVAVAEWLCRVTGAAVVLLLPLAWKDSPDLQRLGPAQRVVCLGPAAEEQDPQPEHATPPSAGMSVSVTPLEGLPHPNSEAERTLYRLIRADAELAPLLEFNQTVTVDLQQKFRIDILCRTRRVAVEVDGADHRVAASKYAADCERDYRMMKTGYLVLRLPNELVFVDPNLAMARIRDIVRYRGSHQP